MNSNINFNNTTNQNNNDSDKENCISRSRVDYAIDLSLGIHNRCCHVVDCLEEIEKIVDNERNQIRPTDAKNIKNTIIPMI